MSDLITYPTVAMQQAAKEIRTLLDEQWSRHMALYQTSPTSFTALTASLTNGLPGGKGQEVQQRVEEWHQNLAKVYASLYALADALENGSINADDYDQEYTQLFSGFNE